MICLVGGGINVILGTFNYSMYRSGLPAPALETCLALRPTSPGTPLPPGFLPLSHISCFINVVSWALLAVRVASHAPLRELARAGAAGSPRREGWSGGCPPLTGYGRSLGGWDTNALLTQCLPHPCTTSPPAGTLWDPCIAPIFSGLAFSLIGVFIALAIGLEVKSLIGGGGDGGHGHGSVQTKSTKSAQL